MDNRLTDYGIHIDIDRNGHQCRHDSIVEPRLNMSTHEHARKCGGRVEFVRFELCIFVESVSVIIKTAMRPIDLRTFTGLSHLVFS